MNIHEDIINRYKTTLLAAIMNNAWRDATPRGEKPSTSNHHLYWMLEQMNTFEDAHKAHRWLGYVQGVMVMKGYINVEEEREFTRGYFKQELST